MDSSSVDRNRPTTRADVARLAGVSTAVVSYVVNGGPRGVSPATREKVLRAIEVLDYRPNSSARALKRGATHLLGDAHPRSHRTTGYTSTGFKVRRRPPAQGPDRSWLHRC